MASRKKSAQTKPKRAPAPRRQRSRRPDVITSLDRFLTVGIGASAGGLEAIEAFFSHMPTDSGMAFVVVTHQPVHRTSLLPEILGRCTGMPVREAADGIPLEPNHVYVAPSTEGYLSIWQTTLRILPTSEDVRLPIDAFFRALADDQQERAVGIVLSGTGTDGTLGLQAIKGASGLILVQEPQSAQYDGMPRSAMAANIIDYVLPPSVMPEYLLAYAQRFHLQGQTPEAASLPPDVLDRILLLLRSHVGYDFSGYKPTTIRRRMNLHYLTDSNQYLQFLHENPQELRLIFKELLITVTRFFRDPEAFDALATQVLPQILASKANDDVVRFWVPGCATGEEAYSIGILVYEGLEQAGKHCKVQIFATDLDSQAIEVARQGVYPEGIAVDVSADRLSRFFTKEGANYRIDKPIRDMVIFTLHNLISEPPFTKLDLVSCRNLLIYLDATLQKRLVPLLHYVLQPGGFLFLGTSESIPGFDDLFDTVDTRWKLFRRKDVVSMMPLQGEVSLPLATSQPAHWPPRPQALPDPATQREMRIDKLLLARYAPPSVIITDRGDIVHIHGRTSPYLELASGQPHLNLLGMVHEGCGCSCPGPFSKPPSSRTKSSWSPSASRPRGVKGIGKTRGQTYAEATEKTCGSPATHAEATGRGDPGRTAPGSGGSASCRFAPVGVRAAGAPDRTGHAE